MPNVKIEGDLNGRFTVNGIDFSKLSVCEWQKMLSQIAAPVYKPMEGWVLVGRGSKPWLIRVARKTFGDVREVIDCQTMYSAANAGHGNEAILGPVSEYMRHIWSPSGNNLNNDRQLPAYYALSRLVGGNYGVMLKTGGGEAVDTAIKAAREFWWTRHGKPQEETNQHGPYIVVAENAFHGRTLGATSLFPRESLSRKGFGPFPNGTLWVPFNDTEALYRMLHLRDDVAGVLLEPIQGEGGIIVPDDDYLPHVEKICHEHGALFMLDGIQTDFGRTGKNFAHEHYGVMPDILTLAKALGGGAMPASAVLARKDVSFNGGKTTYDIFSCLEAGKEGQTWMGAGIICQAILASIKELCDNELAKKAAENGARFIADLNGLKKKYPRLITDVRGKGLMVGVDFAISSLAVSKKLLEEGVWAAATGKEGRTLRFLPPLVTPPGVLSAVVKRLERALLKCKR